MTKRIVPPDGALLNSVANANHKWWIVLAEWIDNAFDADAKTVSIEFARDAIRITDDGDGCADPTNMIRLGAHAKHSSTGLGRYGIGGKEAALWVGGMESTVALRSVHDGIRRTLQVDWSEYAKKWELDDVEEQPARENERGTEIMVTPTKKPPSGNDWSDLLERLAYLYSAALKQGRQIKFRRPTKGATWEPLKRWELPKFQGEIVDTHISVGARRARVYCGVVRQGEPNPRAGFTYLHRWRVIEQSSGNGCGEYGPAHMCGFVDLDASWPLTKNKDAVRKEDAEALYAAVEEAARPVLERAKEIGVELSSRRFEAQVNEKLHALFSQRRAKAKRGDRKPQGEDGKKPTGEGGKHERAAKEQDGKTFPKREHSSYTVRFEHLGKVDQLGQVKKPTVLLNLDNPMVARVNRDEIADAVVVMAASLIGAEHCYAPSGQPLLPGIPMGASTEEFSRAVGTILSTDLALDGKPVAPRVQLVA